MLKNVLRNSPSLVDFFNNIIVSPLVFWHLAYGQLFSSYLKWGQQERPQADPKSNSSGISVFFACLPEVMF